MIQNEIGKRYAKALYTAAKQAGNQDKILGELKSIAKAFESDNEIRNYFVNPLVSANQKEELVKKTLSGKNVSTDIQNLLLLMAKKSRLAYLGSVVEAFQSISDTEKGITSGVVRAAKPLSPEDKKSLEEKINQVLKKKIVLTFKEDASLLGGIVAEVGGWTFDDSIESHLKKLNEALIK